MPKKRITAAQILQRTITDFTKHPVYLKKRDKDNAARRAKRSTAKGTAS